MLIPTEVRNLISGRECEQLLWASVNGRAIVFRGNHAMVPGNTVAQSHGGAGGTNSAQSRRIIRLIGSFMLIL